MSWMTTGLPTTTTSDEDDGSGPLGLDISWTALVGIFLGIFVVLLMLACLCLAFCPWCKKKRIKRRETKRIKRESKMMGSNNNVAANNRNRGDKEFYQKVPLPTKPGGPARYKNSPGDVPKSDKNPNIMKAVEKVLIEEVIASSILKSSRLTLGDAIGHGAFGVVYKGKLSDKNNRDTVDVAVKTVQGDEVTVESASLFIKEALRMKRFKHENVLTALGIVIMDDKPFVVLPFMDNGDLKSFIQRPDLDLVVRDLVEFGVQVAQGMAYLADHGFVHRDLAARNCVVSKNTVIKVSDFGLSRDLYAEEYYKPSDLNTPLPIKWMAIESLTPAPRWSLETDVWSFGILLFELVTRGATPYHEMDSYAVTAYVKAGKRLKQPPHCPDNIYNLMMRCWDAMPSARPPFKMIVKELNELLAVNAEPADYLAVINETPGYYSYANDQQNRLKNTHM